MDIAFEIREFDILYQQNVDGVSEKLLLSRG